LRFFVIISVKSHARKEGTTILYKCLLQPEMGRELVMNIHLKLFFDYPYRREA